MGSWFRMVITDALASKESHVHYRNTKGYRCICIIQQVQTYIHRSSDNMSILTLLSVCLF